MVRQAPPDEQDPISTVAGRTQGRFLRSAVRQASFHRLFRPSLADEHDDTFRSDLAGWHRMIMMMTLFLHSDPAMYMIHGCSYARVGIRDPARMYVCGRIFFLAHWPLYVCTCYVCASTTIRARLYIDQYVRTRSRPE